MLPSGNDAAWALAESFGLIIHHLRHSSSNRLPNEIIDIEGNNNIYNNNNLEYPEKVFLEEMNKMG